MFALIESVFTKAIREKVQFPYSMIARMLNAGLPLIHCIDEELLELLLLKLLLAVSIAVCAESKGWVRGRRHSFIVVSFVL